MKSPLPLIQHLLQRQGKKYFSSNAQSGLMEKLEEFCRLQTSNSNETDNMISAQLIKLIEILLNQNSNITKLHLKLLSIIINCWWDTQDQFNGKYAETLIELFYKIREANLLKSEIIHILVNHKFAKNEQKIQYFKVVNNIANILKKSHFLNEEIIKFIFAKITDEKHLIDFQDHYVRLNEAFNKPEQQRFIISLCLKLQQPHNILNIICNSLSKQLSVLENIPAEFADIVNTFFSAFFPKENEGNLNFENYEKVIDQYLQNFVFLVQQGKMDLDNLYLLSTYYLQYTSRFLKQKNSYTTQNVNTNIFLPNKEAYWCFWFTSALLLKVYTKKYLFITIPIELFNEAEFTNASETKEKLYELKDVETQQLATIIFYFVNTIKEIRKYAGIVFHYLLSLSADMRSMLFILIQASKIRGKIIHNLLNTAETKQTHNTEKLFHLLNLQITEFCKAFDGQWDYRILLKYDSMIYVKYILLLEQLKFSLPQGDKFYSLIKFDSLFENAVNETFKNYDPRKTEKLIDSIWNCFINYIRKLRDFFAVNKDLLENIFFSNIFSRIRINEQENNLKTKLNDILKITKKVDDELKEQISKIVPSEYVQIKTILENAYFDPSLKKSQLESVFLGVIKDFIRQIIEEQSNILKNEILDDFLNNQSAKELINLLYNLNSEITLKAICNNQDIMLSFMNQNNFQFEKSLWETAIHGLMGLVGDLKEQYTEKKRLDTYVQLLEASNLQYEIIIKLASDGDDYYKNYLRQLIEFLHKDHLDQTNISILVFMVSQENFYQLKKLFSEAVQKKLDELQIIVYQLIVQYCAELEKQPFEVYMYLQPQLEKSDQVICVFAVKEKKQILKTSPLKNRFAFSAPYLATVSQNETGDRKDLNLIVKQPKQELKSKIYYFFKQNYVDKPLFISTASIKR